MNTDDVINERKDACAVCEAMMPHDQTVSCDVCGQRVCAPGTYTQDCCSRGVSDGRDELFTICRNCED